ncbi:MAG: class I SAM-dependent methyltransferase [Acetobacteraceae bacterium]|nr:class I SAM-dependent methyltransferase [Acetobacteraceae bacterium]
MSEGFDAGWLALREPHDARARSAAIAGALIATLPARPRLLDLGAGSGSLFRWLAPRIYRAQAWTLFDADAGLIEAAFETIALWAEALGLKVTTPGRALLVHAPGGAWRVEARQGDLAEIGGLPLAGHHAVVNSALCDLVSRPWLAALSARLSVPFYAALIADGRVRWRPHLPADRALAAAFRRDQGRDKGLGPALGHRAPAAAIELFEARGFCVLSAPSDWRIGPDQTAMLSAILHGDADAACRADPRHRARHAAWRQARMLHGGRGRLSLRLGHRDVLAIPR